MHLANPKRDFPLKIIKVWFGKFMDEAYSVCFDDLCRRKQ